MAPSRKKKKKGKKSKAAVKKSAKKGAKKSKGKKKAKAAKPKSEKKPKPKRSTVSLESTTIDLARRICRAWEDHFGRLPTINEVVNKGLEVVVKVFKKKGIKLPKKAAAMRPGPKGEGEEAL